MQSKQIFIGVDVSKDTLDVSVNASKDHLRIANKTAGYQHLNKWLQGLRIALNDCWFVLEYTGGYEYRFIQFLQAKGLRFTRVAGLEIKRSMGMQRGKNDKTDARRIAEYGQQKEAKLKPHQAPAAPIVRLRQLLTQRSGFVKMRKAQQQRLKELQCMVDVNKGDPLIKHYQQAVVFAQKMVGKTEAVIETLLAAQAHLSRSVQLLTSIPGIGKINAWMTIAYTENFERFTNARKYGAYSGVVPYEHQSGKSIRGKSRVSHMANKTIKAELDMAAKASIQHDPEIKAYYERRKLLGKHHMSIMNEVKFKLILRMFAVVHKGEPYRKNIAIAA